MKTFVRELKAGLKYEVPWLKSNITTLWPRNSNNLTGSQEFEPHTLHLYHHLSMLVMLVDLAVLFQISCQYGFILI